MAINRYINKWPNRAIVICWLLLIYVLAALIWWYIALNQQNNQMASYRLQLLNQYDPHYTEKANQINSYHKRLSTAYKSEGLTFILVILAGAVFLRSAVMRQIRIQRQQQNFMMAITHELKTPISIAKLNIETLMKYQLDESKKEKILKSSLHELFKSNMVSTRFPEPGFWLNKKACIINIIHSGSDPSLTIRCQFKIIITSFSLT